MKPVKSFQEIVLEELEAFAFLILVIESHKGQAQITALLVLEDKSKRDIICDP